MFQSDPLYITYLCCLALSVIISLVLMVYAWMRRTVPCALPLVGLLISGFFWSFGYIIEYLSTDLESKLFSFNISYIGAEALPVFLLLFMLQYGGHGKLITKNRVILLFIIPLITLLLQWTKGFHSLMYFNYSLGTDGPFLLVLKSYGIWFYIALAYNYTLLITSAVLLIYRLFQPPRIYKSQVIYMIFMLLVPALANFFYVFRLIPIPHADWTPASFTFSTIMMALVIFERRLLDIIPIARESVIETMNEGFVITDSEGFIIDFNKSALSITDSKIGVGRKLPEDILNQLIVNFKNPVGKNSEIKLVKGELPRYYNVNISPIYSDKKLLSGCMFLFHDYTERKQAEDAVWQIAYHDYLTSLPNRALFYDRAKVAIENAARYERKLAVFMLDVDNFKEINDTLGHEAGDFVLKEVGQRLLQWARKMDTVARFGGDEFIILLTEITGESALDSIAMRLLSFLSKPIRYKENTIYSSASVGIAVYPGDSSDIEILIKLADHAMYKVKQQGGNFYLRYSPDMN